MTENVVKLVQNRKMENGYERPADLPEPQTRAEKARATKVQKARRRMQVMDLRAAGLTNEQIAEHLGMTKNGVARVINNTLEEWGKRDQESAQKVRTQKMFELDQLKRAVWAKAISGDIKAIREVTKIIQLQARLAGAEAPVQHEHHGSVTQLHLDRGEIDRMERIWIDQGGTVEGTATEDRQIERGS